MLILGGQELKLLAFPSQWAWIAPVMEHGRRPWSGPCAPLSNYSMGRKGISSLLCACEGQSPLKIDGRVSGQRWGFVEALSSLRCLV